MVRARATGRRAVVVALLALGTSGALVPASAAPVGQCRVSAAAVVGWGGSRYVTTPPQGVGAGCNFLTLFANEITLVVSSIADAATYPAASFPEVPPLHGGQIILPDGRRFFCRQSLQGLGQSYVPGVDVSCEKSPFTTGLRMRVTLEKGFVSGSVYCSTTGEVDVLVDTHCYDNFNEPPGPF